MRRRTTYAVAVLLLATLLPGCGDPARRPAGPSARPPSATGTDGSTAGPPTAGSPTGPASPTTGISPSAAPSATGNPRYAFPVRGNASYNPTHSAYPATDIFADCGSLVVAVTDGTILEVSLVDQYSRSGPQGPFNGGKSVSLLGDDGVRYYGSHLTDVASGIRAGVRVRVGQQVGTVGRTGNANNVCHLHFGISPGCQRTADWWIRRGVIWPATYLDAWRRKINMSPVATVEAWRRRHGCPKAP